jgi:hypothetical protein
MSNSRETPPLSSEIFVRRQKVAPQPAANDPLDFLQVNAQANARPTSRHPSIADQPLPPPPLPLRNVAAAYASASQTLAYCVAAGTPSGDMPCMPLLSIILHDALSSISCRLKPQRSSPSATPPTNQQTNFSTASQHCCFPFVSSFLIRLIFTASSCACGCSVICS